MIEIDRHLARALLPPRDAASHKGDFGHALIVAGALGYAGAACLAAEGALRSGAGLVTLAVPARIQDTVASALPECMTRGLPCSAEGTLDAGAAAEAARLARARSAFAVGPGISTAASTAKFLDGFLALAGDVPRVIDADALNLIASSDAMLALGPPCVLTPHPGEAARLLSITTAEVQADRCSAIRQLAERTTGAVVLKGNGTLVASRDGRIAFNRTGGHGLAKGGSGDCLTGIVCGLLAQGLPAFEAACLGAYAHGLAGDIAQERTGARAMLARDVLAALGEAWQRIEAG